MHKLQGIACLVLIWIFIGFASTAHAERRRGINFEMQGLELVGWVPYSPERSTSIPTIKLPNGELPLDYPATIVNFSLADKTHGFTLSIAVDRKVDHSQMHLVARDEKDVVIQDVAYSIVASTGEKLKQITFIGSCKCDPKIIKQLIIAVPSQKRL